MSEAEVTSRSCPTCHSIGIPRWRYPNGQWTDVPSYGGGGVAERCSDMWHQRRAVPVEQCLDCDSTGMPRRVPETGDAFCRNPWHLERLAAMARRLAAYRFVAQELQMIGARMQLYRVPYARQCSSEYQWSGGRQYGDWIVRCQLGEHVGIVHLEVDIEMIWEERT